MNIGFCVFASHTKEKYKKQIEKINETWYKDLNDKCKLFYFLNKTPHTFENKKNVTYINLNIEEDDYFSVQQKQQLGLKYIYENYNPNWVFICGTDTYPNIKNILLLLKKYNSNDNLYIGGHGSVRKVLGKNLYYHSGGPGIILSNNCLMKLQPFLNTMTEKWLTIWEKSKKYFKPQCGINKAACDITLSYFIKTHIKSKVIKNKHFFHCNYLGEPCVKHHLHKKPDLQSIISCHQMSLQDFDNYNKIINSHT
tara:strand:+ start:686 stop:1444 length:759 start_codon:yes stop_codon:yes gene_type:complete